MSQLCPLCGKTKLAEALFCGECERRIRSDYEVKVPENEREVVSQRQEISEDEIVGPGPSGDKYHGIPGPGKNSKMEENPKIVKDPEIAKDLEPEDIKPKKKKKVGAPLLFLLVILFLGGAFLIYNETARKENLERSGWETALKLNSVGGYIDYMEAFPDGAHFDEAQEGLFRLKSEEVIVWEQLKASGNTSELRGFLNSHPQSPYAPLVQKMIDSLSWMSALRVNTLESYSDYLMQSQQGELLGDYIAEARKRQEMLHQSFPVEPAVMDRIRDTLGGFYASLSGANHQGAFPYLAPTVRRFFNSGAASRERITGELLMARTRARGATLSFEPDMEALQYERTGSGHYLVNMPLTKSYSQGGSIERVPGYIVHIELNPEFEISSIHESKPHPEAP